MDSSTSATWRRRALPHRWVGERLVIARPVDGRPTVLNATAAAIWDGLTEWAPLDSVTSSIGERYVEVTWQELNSAVAMAVVEMESEGLVERTGT